MSQQAWFEHFKEQLQGLTESFAESGTSVSLLKYALQEQRLSPEKYLTWAMSHYLLPQLQSRFFTETPVSQEMFARWATHYPWSEECLPVAEWDGSLIVACLQPPQDFPSNPTCILVLATPQNLQETWKQLHPEKADGSNIPKSMPSEAPEGIDLSASSPTPAQKTDGASFEDFNIENSSDPEQNLEGDPSEWAIPSEEGLEGIFDGPTVVQLKPFSMPPLATSEAETACGIEPAPVEAETACGIETAPKTTESALNDEATPSILEPATPATASPADKTVVTTIPRPGRATKPTLNPVTSGGFYLDKIKKKNATLVNEKVKKLLAEMKVHFKKSLILTVDESESQLTVFAWDENFQGMKDTSMRLPLKTPSIFSIVSSTQKPFHGYISLNEINEKFFEDWNQGQIPDHVTITPLILNQRLVGMVMGFAEKSAYNKVSLSFTEKISHDFIEGLKAA